MSLIGVASRSNVHAQIQTNHNFMLKLYLSFSNFIQSNIFIFFGEKVLQSERLIGYHSRSAFLNQLAYQL